MKYIAGLIFVASVVTNSQPIITEFGCISLDPSRVRYCAKVLSAGECTIELQYRPSGELKWEIAYCEIVNRVPEYVIADTLEGESWSECEFRCKAANIGGTTYSDTIRPTVMAIGESPGPVMEFSLAQNYPNPFNPTTVIQYSMPVAGLVSLRLFNTQGVQVLTLMNRVEAAGDKLFILNAQSLPSGVYFYQLISGDHMDTKKMTLIR